MTSSNSYSSLYPFPFDLNQDDPHQHHHLLTFKSQPPPPPPPSSSLSSSSSSSLTCPIPFNPTHVQDQQAVHHQREPQQFHDQLQEKIYVPQDGPVKSTDCDLKLSIWKNEERLEAETHQSNENISSAKWMPSKMRILRKMMSSDHKDLSNNSKPKPEDDQKQQQPPSPDTSLSYSNNNTIRVCSDCNTTKTPLWRSGPRGPKSLCNACGIRQRKARRAMAAAAAANGPVVAAETPAGIKSEGLHHKAAKRSSNNCVPGFKKNKKCKHNSQSRKKKNLRLEELRIILSKNSAFHQVFPQDEKEAAILLMALSYGLVHG